MRKLMSMAIGIGMVFLSACKDDEVPKSNVVFGETELEVKESDGGPTSFHPLLFDKATGREIKVPITLDRALAETSIIAFTITGTAKVNSTSNPVGDFEIKGNDENITIQKGESSVDLIIQLYEDEQFEIDASENLFETIIIKLTSVVSGTAVIGTDDTFTLKIIEDDGVVFLDWDDGDGVAPSDRGDVDMDAFLFLDGRAVANAAAEGSADYEAFNFSNSLPNGSYGLSYTYYSGTSNAVTIFSEMLNFGGTLNGKTYASFEGPYLSNTAKYTLANINKYDVAGAPAPAIVQTMTKTGFNYTNISSITVPAKGSRMASSEEVSKLKTTPLTKMDSETAKRLRSLMRKK
jgi:hypothetical protein